MFTLFYIDPDFYVLIADEAVLQGNRRFITAELRAMKVTEQEIVKAFNVVDDVEGSGSCPTNFVPPSPQV